MKTPSKPIQPSHSINHHLEKELNIGCNFCLADENSGCYPPILRSCVGPRVGGDLPAPFLYLHVEEELMSQFHCSPRAQHINTIHLTHQ